MAWDRSALASGKRTLNSSLCKSVCVSFPDCMAGASQSVSHSQTAWPVPVSLCLIPRLHVWYQYQAYGLAYRTSLSLSPLSLLSPSPHPSPLSLSLLSLSLSSPLPSGPDLEDRDVGAGDGDDRGGGDGGGRGGGGGGGGGGRPPGDSSRMKKSAQQLAGERVLSRAVQEVEGVSFSFR